MKSLLRQSKHRLIATITIANSIRGHFTTARQKGWGCELTAMAGVMRWLYNNNAIQREPHPARKRDKANAVDSLRAIAKRKYGTQIGEIVDPEVLLKVARDNKEIVASCLECPTEEAYHSALMTAIDLNLAPMVYFDVESGGKDAGMPICSAGRNYHVAVVTGYSTNAYGELMFTLHQWQEKYVVRARDLFASTSQLLDRPSFEETYVKVRTEKGEGAWFPKRLVNNYFKNPVIIKESKPIHYGSNGGMKNKIFIIDSRHRIDALVPQLSAQIRALKKDSCRLAKSKMAALTALQCALRQNANQETLYILIEQWKNQQSSYKGMSNINLIRKQRYDGWFSFLFNPKRTTSARIIEDTLRDLPKVAT